MSLPLLCNVMRHSNLLPIPDDSLLAQLPYDAARLAAHTRLGNLVNAKQQVQPHERSMNMATSAPR